MRRDAAEAGFGYAADSFGKGLGFGISADRSTQGGGKAGVGERIGRGGREVEVLGKGKKGGGFYEGNSEGGGDEEEGEDGKKEHYRFRCSWLSWACPDDHDGRLIFLFLRAQ